MTIDSFQGFENLKTQDGFNIIEFDRQNFAPEIDPLEELYAIREQLSPGYAPEHANKHLVAKSM